MIRKSLRLWHTVRWLRPAQVWGRLWLRLARPHPDLRPAPPMRLPQAGLWQGCARAPSMLEARRFRFLSVERELAEPRDWHRADWPRLWLYNAHYFDDLVADGAGARISWHRDLIARWIAENSPGQGQGWEPYPTSLRVVNWVKWVLAGNALDKSARHSLAVQARWLRRRLEFHLLGNHLWANAKALVFAGAFFAGAEADRWRNRGLVLLRRELGEQILPDGGHFERSPMYHAIVLEDLLDLVQLATMHPGLFVEADIARWKTTAMRMLRWLRVMTHPDGEIALFNDAALGIAPNLAALDAYATKLGLLPDPTPLASIEALPDSGYVRMQSGSAVLIADVGAIGPDYLLGHAHADTLSFELSLRGQRVLVNGGISTYEPGPERLRQRGTAAHNTVMVDGQDSSEVWSSFRVARRAQPHDVSWGVDTTGAVWLAAAHDGYRRLPGHVTHQRRWEMDEKRLQVVDVLAGSFTDAKASFRVGPGMRLRPERADAGLVLTDAGLMHWQIRGHGAQEAMPGSWHPRFGISEPCQVLVLSFSGAMLETDFCSN